MQIVVAGRFDYIKSSWHKSIQDKKILYFDNESRNKITFIDRVKRKIHHFLKKYRLVKKLHARRMEILDGLNEYFQVYSLKRRKPVIFILYEMNLISTDFESLDILKSYFKKSRFVFFFSNVIGSVRQEITKNVLLNRDKYDLIYTFNPLDAKRYKLRTFCGGVFPYDAMNFAEDEHYKSDVFWVGKNKNRLSKLVEIKKQLDEKSILSKFIITGEKDEESNTDIEFEEKAMEYDEVLKNIYNSKALLDLSWDGVPSLRYTEAIAYSKLLITDNAHMLKEPACIKVEDLGAHVLDMEAKWKYTSKQIGTKEFINEISELLKVDA